jgi:Acetyltransferase (GNAT) family
LTHRPGRGEIIPVVHLPAERLPDGRREREQILLGYIEDRVPNATRDGDMWAVRLLTPPRADYYIDPLLREGLAWWSQFARPVLIRDIPYALRRRRGVQVSLSDAWTIASWSRLLAAHANPQAPVVVLHADDHEDLMSPLLAVRDTALVDLISGKPVYVDRPATVDAALRSGAISMGSFIVPMLSTGHEVHIRHLRYPASRQPVPGRYRLVLAHEPDALFAPGERRPTALIVEPNACLHRDQAIVGSYTLTEKLDDWLDDVPEDALLLLHVDCDYFNNRYDGDSDWRSHSRIHDPPERHVQHRVEELCDALRSLANWPDDVTIALSPAFFPAEYWQETVETLLRSVTVRRRLQAQAPAKPIAVRLEAGKGSPGRGGGHGGKFWHIYNGDRRAGSVWINQADDSDLGEHASLTIELNEASRGKGIGRRAYRLAAEASEHEEIWLHMRRSNIASRKAAEHAGYTIVDVRNRRQLVMRWQRSDS